jgi:hypothetical protein
MRPRDPQAAEVPTGRPPASAAGAARSAAPASLECGDGYFFPVTARCARRFFCQQASFDSLQTGTSLP